MERNIRDPDTDGEEGHVTKEAEIGVMDASTSQGMPRIASHHQELEEARKDRSLEASEEAQAC